MSPKKPPLEPQPWRRGGAEHHQTAGAIKAPCLSVSMHLDDLKPFTTLGNNITLVPSSASKLQP